MNVNIHDDLNLSIADEAEVESSSKARKNVNQLNIIKQKDQDDSNQKTIHILFYSSPSELIAEDGTLKT